MEAIASNLSVAAVVLNFVGYTMYCIFIMKSASRPNLTTWLFIATLAGLNAASYAAVSGLLQAAPYFVGATGSIVVVLLAWRFKRFSVPSRTEAIAAALCVVSIALWIAYRDAGIANILFLAALTISWWPTYAGVRHTPSNEHPLPWTLWGLTFGTMAAASIIEPESSLVSTINPLVLTLCHGLVAFECSRTRRN